MIRTTLAGLLLFAVAATAGDITIRNNGGAFQVVGWTAPAQPTGGWESIFTVSVGPGDAPPMLGSYSLEAGVLTFRPRWPIDAAMSVRASFHPAGVPKVDAVFDPRVPKQAPSTSISHVYPSAEELPENALRMYVYFSAAMRRGEA